jgi:peroxiredoxin Q/BCP
VEASEFRDELAVIEKKGGVVLGISPDSPQSHQKFSQKLSLPYPLLADVGAKVAQAYGVWVEKSRYGRTYMGVERATFLIDGEGKIAKVWRNVKAQGHAKEVAKTL